MIEFGIVGFFRYRDDIWVHGHDISRFKLWFWELQRRAGYFKLSCECISHSNLEFLSIQVDIDRSAGLFHTAPVFKKTALGPPLAATSAHTPSVHLTWPSQVLRSLRGLASREESFVHAKSEFISRFRSFFEPLRTIDRLSVVEYSTVMAPVSRRNARSTLWLVLPYHPAVYDRVRGAVAKFNDDVHVRVLYSHAFRVVTQNIPYVRIAWRNHYQPLEHRLS